MSTIRRRNIAFAVAGVVVSTVLALLLAELGLRAVGFSYRLYPERVEFGYPDPQNLEKLFVPDQELFWVHADYRERLRPPGIERPTLVLLGDSCTEIGTFDRRLARSIAERYPGWRPAFVKVAVSGWSSYQGMRALERDVVPLAPRVVTIYFGWNDHWIGFGIEDKQVARVLDRTPRALEGLRLIQLVHKARVAWGQRSARGLRVAVEDYRRNLLRMIETARAHDIVPVLLTAPSGHRRGHEPEHLRERHLPDLEQLVPLHREYNQVVRDVAGEAEAVLCDTASAFAGFSPNELERLFWPDGVHLRPRGNRLLAERLFACFERHGLVELLVL